MTLPIDNNDLAARFDQGAGAVELARVFGTSYQVISYRLRRMGRVSRDRKPAAVGPGHIRALRDNFSALRDVAAYLAQQREDLISRMGDNPGPKTLDRLGQLTDFIQVMREVTR